MVPTSEPTLPAIVLASASPRRRELLTAMGLAFTVAVSAVDEEAITAPDPRTLALRLALAKANAVAASQPAGALVIGADTVVARSGVLFAKPADADDARLMVRELAGGPHDVITGVAIVRAGRDETVLDAVRTRVVFRALSEAEIDAYVATGEPLDKAGAYGIQGHGGELVDHIEGDYFNVVGLPCAMLSRLLASIADLPPLTLPKPPQRFA